MQYNKERKRTVGFFWGKNVYIDLRINLPTLFLKGKIDDTTSQRVGVLFYLFLFLQRKTEMMLSLHDTRFVLSANLSDGAAVVIDVVVVVVTIGYNGSRIGNG